MKKLKQFLSDIFKPEEYNDLDTAGIAQALNDASVRNIWLVNCLNDLKTINQDVDRRLLQGSEFGLLDLCARRKAYQDILEGILSARRQVTQEVRPNPRASVSVDLDRVTV